MEARSQNPEPRREGSGSRRAFSLIELLVVLAVIALTCSILMPALGAVRSRARSAVCGNNLRQLVLANSGYATENGGFYVQAAADLWDNAGCHRWHGVRDRLDEPFDPTRGPLVRYLADGTIRQCPQKIRFLTGKAWAQDFEQGCGGYGYNMAYLGSRLWDRGCATTDPTLAYAKTSRMTEVARPCQTLMFSDTAMCTDGTSLIEYSFAEPPHPVMAGQVIEQVKMSPSIHFRHLRSANVGWSDGHVDRQAMAGAKGENAYGVCSASLSLGWFEPEDNSLFDLH
jgi:prepilin-type N-terminal cleavage/methylation domain-containing protein/prepilin-type processing-associated H-X9-DG protein